MNKYYYVGADNKSYGPILPTEFTRYGINASTLVCPVGGTSWIPVGSMPELQMYINPQQPSYGAGNNYGQQGVSPSPMGNNPGFPPPTYMVWAILVTIFCCLPFGIVAIIKASNVNSAWYAGNYDLAVKNSEDAKKWCIYSVVASVAVTILYFVFFVGMLGAAL